MRHIRVVTVVTEIPPASVDAAADAAAALGARFVLNPAPVVALADSTWSLADPLVVNEHEAVELAQVAFGTEPGALATSLRRATGARTVIVTLGARGAVVDVGMDGAARQVVSAAPVRPVDTTGAGDTFVGALSAALAEDADLARAVAAATAAAGEATTWLGARPPM